MKNQNITGNMSSTLKKQNCQTFLYLIAVLLIVPFSYAALSDNLVSAYSFDEDSSIHADAVNGYDLTGDNNENHYNSSGINNGCVYSSGDDWEDGNIYNFTGKNITFSFWYKGTFAGTIGLVTIYQASNTAVHTSLQYDSGKFRLYYTDPTFSSGYIWQTSDNVPNEGDWHHCYFNRWEGHNEVNMVIDNVSYAGSWTSGNGEHVSADSEKLRVMADRTYSIQGNIDELYIWDRILEADEITALAEGTFYPFSSSPASSSSSFGILHIVPVTENRNIVNLASVDEENYAVKNKDQVITGIWTFINKVYFSDAIYITEEFINVTKEINTTTINAEYYCIYGVGCIENFDLSSFNNDVGFFASCNDTDDCGYLKSEDDNLSLHLNQDNWNNGSNKYITYSQATDSIDINMSKSLQPRALCEIGAYSEGSGDVTVNVHTNYSNTSSINLYSHLECYASLSPSGSILSTGSIFLSDGGYGILLLTPNTAQARGLFETDNTGSLQITLTPSSSITVYLICELGGYKCKSGQIVIEGPPP